MVALATKQEEIVKAFFQHGRLLTPAALGYLEGKNVENFLQASEGPVLDVSDFQDSIRIIKNFNSKKSELTAGEFAGFYRRKFEKMKAVIEGRLQKDFISLNKMPAGREEIYLIAAVRDIRDAVDTNLKTGSSAKKIVELEDPTASVTVIFDAAETDGLETDDVVAIQAVVAGKVFGKKIIYPDLPLRQPATGKGLACFISDLHLDESPRRDAERFFQWFERQDIKHLFVAGDIGGMQGFEALAKNCIGKKIFVIPGEADTGEEYPQLALKSNAGNVICLSNPAMVELNGVKILMAHSADTAMLRKRFLGKTKIPQAEEYLVLDEVPDIVHCGHTHQPEITNYKSTTIVNAGSLLSSFRPVVVNLESRDAEQVSVL